MDADVKNRQMDRWMNGCMFEWNGCGEWMKWMNGMDR